jgi:UrcA family protein
MAAGLAAAVLAPAPALAQGQEIVITVKRLPNGFEPVTQNVKISDLNLATSEGVSAMEKRVTGAINSMCTVTGSTGILPANEGKTCRDYAWASARPQMDRATQAATQKQ